MLIERKKLELFCIQLSDNQGEDYIFMYNMTNNKGRSLS